MAGRFLPGFGQFSAYTCLHLGQFSYVFLEQGGRIYHSLGGSSIGEDAEESIVILLAYGVELVVVAASAGNG